MDVWGRFLYKDLFKLAFVALSVLSFLFVVHAVFAATIHEYKDTLSNSVPSEYSNHTIQFKTTVAIPPGGYVRFIPEDGAFTVPVSDFDIDNVEMYVSASAESGYTLRTATVTPDAVDDGVAITTGTSGNIEVTLNSTTGIPANRYIRLLIGSHTTNATTTDVGLLNPSATGTFEFHIEAGGGGTDERVRGHVATVDRVSVPNLDTTETDPPVRFNGAPSGTISGTSLAVQISVETDEFSKCRYSTASGTPYFSMGSEFTSNFTTIHPETISVSTSTTYTFFIRCIDDEGNVNIDDYVLTFTVPEYPEGTPGAEGEDEGEGSGTGEGSGDVDDGGGDPSGGDDSSGGSSGGGGGGGGGGGTGSSSGGDDGGGGLEGSEKVYQSGDGRVIVNGYAFPRSTVYVLVDGQIAEQDTAGTTGEFSVLIDLIARGVYTFGVYAVDKNGTRSSTFSTTFTVSGARGSTLSNINVMPSIKVTPNPVDPNSIVQISGFAIPDATITIENQNDKSSASLKTLTATSDANGAWSIDLSTSGFQTGTYKVRAKARQDGGVSTNFSDFTYYGVGAQAQVPQTSDLNRDGKVNLIDFSILLYWWNSNGGASNPPADINRDGKVSLTDFSIMIFNWTG